MNSCDRDEEGNIIDPITLDTIPIDRLITFEQLGRTFCFDIDSLSTLDSTINPLNREPLPIHVINSINRYRDGKMILVYIDGTTNSIMTLPNNSIGNVIIEVYRSRNEMERIGSDDIHYGNGVSLYDRDLTSPIDSIASGRSIRLRIVPLERYRAHRMRTLYRYSISNHITWLSEIIPEIYHRDPIIIPSDPMDELIISSYMINGLERQPHVSDIYFTTGITRLLHDAKISAKFALVMEKYIITRGNGRWDMLLPILYSRVVDPHTLPEDHDYYTEL